ncbi:endonuclease Q family protein [Patescibacteria group bacterium]
MRYIADLHIHSKYSRATSQKLNFSELTKWASLKGINLLATADFTHPFWMTEIKKNLEEDGSGFLVPKDSENNIKYIFSVEISNIFQKAGKLRKIHTLILSPDLKTTEEINQALGKIGKLASDGRPIFGQDIYDTVKTLWSINPKIIVIPAHIWTPWFSLFGSRSGFESIEECFEDLTPKIFALETGLSSDPAMNWRISSLDKYSLVSNSDAHSGQKLGREANVFDIPEKELSFDLLSEILEKKDNRFISTIEFYPEEGKYHFDGHRNCEIVFSPEETKKHKSICPKCKRFLTVGVMNRVDTFADRKVGYIPKNTPKVRHIIPLMEIISDVIGVGVSSKAVSDTYFKLIDSFNNEFKILLGVDYIDLEKVTDAKTAQAIINVREGKVNIKPGYDGEFGKISVDKTILKETENKQIKLF